MRHIISSHMLCLYMAWHTILYRVLQWKVHFCDLYRYSLPFPWSWSESCVLAQSSGRKGVEIDFLGKTRPCSQWPDHFCNMDKTCLLKHVYYNKNIKFSGLVDRRNINFHPKEFSILSRGRSPRDEILNSEGWKFMFLRSTSPENFIIINLVNNNI